MPDAGAAAYLLRHFWAAGPTAGDQALTHGELRHYQDNESITLTPWECYTLRRMSGEYMNESFKAREPDCPPPFAESSDAMRLHRLQVREKLRKFLD